MGESVGGGSVGGWECGWVRVWGVGVGGGGYMYCASLQYYRNVRSRATGCDKLPGTDLNTKACINEYSLIHYMQ